VSGSSSDAVRLNFAFEILQSSNLAMVAAVLPIYSDLFQLRARSYRASWGHQGNGYGNLASAAMSAILRGWLRSGEVIMGVTALRCFVTLRLGVRNGPRKGAKSQRNAKIDLGAKVHSVRMSAL